MLPRVEIEQLGREQFLCRLDSLSQTEKFSQAVYSYIECRRQSLHNEDAAAQHFVLLAHEPATKKVAGFHYYYIRPSFSSCYLWGLFVESTFRSHTLGRLLLSEALKQSVLLGATTVHISFTEKNVRHGKLVQGFLRETEQYRPQVKFTIIADGEYL